MTHKQGEYVLMFQLLYICNSLWKGKRAKIKTFQVYTLPNIAKATEFRNLVREEY